MESLLVVGAGEFQIPGIIRAKELGYYVIATDGDKNAPGKEVADEFMLIDVKDIHRHLEIARKKKIAGVVAFAAEVAVETVAYIADELNLVGNKFEVAALSHDKKRYYLRLQEENILVPKMLSSQNRLYFGDQSKRVVVKPSKGSGSRLVAKLELTQVDAYINDNAVNLAKDEEFLVQEHIAGKELTVDCFVYNGNAYILAISEERSREECSVSYELLFPPSWLDEGLKEKVFYITKNVVNAIGIKYGPVHLEYIVDDSQQLYVIDFSMRGGGFKVFTDIVAKTSGEDILAKYIQSAMGKPISIEQPRNFEPVILRFLYANRCGKIKSLSGSENGVFSKHMFFFLKKSGDFVNTPQSGRDRIAYMICWGDSLPKLQEQANYIANQCVLLLDSE